MGDLPSESINTPSVRKKSVNINAMILKTGLFYPRYVKLGSVIYLALIGHSFLSKYEIFCRKPLSKTSKNESKHLARFPVVLLPSNNDSWMCSCSWEDGNPPEEVIHTRGKTFQPIKRKARAKAC